MNSQNLYSELGGADGPLPTPQRVLAIGAHPDDIEFGAGGSIIKWAEAGADITMVIVTDGSKGSWDPATDPATLAATRTAEQVAAGAVLGAGTIIQLDEIDGELEYSKRLRIEMARQIRTHRPTVLLTHDPWQRYQLHPDHRATGMAVVDGVVSARDPLFHPELDLVAHRPAALLLWSADQPDHYEPIAATIDRKIEALLCHSSQGTTTMGDAHTDSDARERFVTRIHDWAQRQGQPADLDLGEAFKRITP